MACLKRLLDGQDPDYEDSAPNEAKRLRLLEQNAKADVSQKVCAIIEREFGKELANKEKESLRVQERLHQAQKTLHLLRYAIVRNYYTQSEQGQPTSQQTRIHPAVKKLIGKQPQHPFWGHLEQRPSKYRQVNSTVPAVSCLKNEPVPPESPAHTSPTKPCTSTEPSNPDPPPSETRVTKVPRYIPPKPNSSKIQPQIGLSRGLRHKVKKRLVIGNISKWIPVDAREDSASHKWMMYVRGSREAPDISGFVSKVRFFLHPSFRPNDVVEVTSSPFHLSRRGWGEFPVRVQVHFTHPLNKPVDLLHHLKLDSSYTGLQRLGAETVVDIWLYTIPTSVNCAPEENDCSGERTEPAATSSPETKGAWNAGHEERESSRTEMNGSPSGDHGSPSGAATNAFAQSGAEVEGNFTVAESQVSAASLRSESMYMKEESGIESCGSSDVSEPAVCKTELNTCEEEVSSYPVPDNFDFNVTVKEEPGYVDLGVDGANPGKEAFDTSDISLEDVKEEIVEIDDVLENGGDNVGNKPEFTSTVFDHDYFSCVEPARTVDNRNNGKTVEQPTTSVCDINNTDVPFSATNGLHEHTVNNFPETEVSSTHSSLEITSSVDTPVSKLNGSNEIGIKNSSDCANSELLSSPAKAVPVLQKDVQKSDVARKATTLVKCMDSLGNIFYITLAGACAKVEQDAPQPAKLDTATTSPQLSCVTRTSCETVTAPSTTVTTAVLYSGTSVSQSSATRGQERCVRGVGVATPNGRAAQQVINVSKQEVKPLLATSLLPPLETAKNVSSVKNLQVFNNNLKAVQTARGLVNVLQTNASQYSSSKKVVLITPTSSVVGPALPKQVQPTLLASSASVASSPPAGVQPKQNQTVLLLRDGQYYIVKQPQDASPSVKSLLALPDSRESAPQAVVRVPQQPGIVFKMPAGGVLNGNPRLDSLLPAATFQARPGSSLLKKKVRCAQSPPPLTPISRPVQQPPAVAKARPNEDVKLARGGELPVVPVIKKVDRKMIVLNRTHGPITAATSSKASHYEERLKAAVAACKFATQTLCVRWLLRHMPLVSCKVSDHNFRTIHPYAAPSHDAFLEWNIGKQRAAEWLRAKSVQKQLLKLCYNEDNVWSTRAIVVWARLHGYTPVPRCGNNSGFKAADLPRAAAEHRNTYSEPVQIMDWLESSSNSSLSPEDDLEIDVIGLHLPLRAVKLEDAGEPGEEVARLDVMEHDRLHETDSMFVRDKVRELGFKMASEQIIPGVTYYAAERALMEAMKSLAEDLLRRALCKAWMRNSNRPPESLMPADVMDAILGRSEFDIFSNFGLGVQAADTG